MPVAAWTIPCAVSTDIDVMQNMLRADGLTDDAPFKL